MDLLVGIDLGTSGVKVSVFDATLSRPVASALRDYPLYHPHPGWAEQVPEDWWKASIAAIRQCVSDLASAGYSPSDLRGLAISGQMHGAVLLDTAGEVIRPAIIWADQRTQAECDEITQRVGQARLIDLVSNPALPGFTAPKILWVRNHEPENWARVAHVLLPKDYIRYRLTGEMASEISDAAGTCLLNVATGQWSDEVLQALDLAPSLFSPVIGATAIGGTITSEIAQLTSLPLGMPVAGGGADNACAAVGAGIVEPGQALVSIGTSGVVLAYSATPEVDRSGPIPRAHTFNHAVPDAWYLMGVTQGAGLSLRWVRDQIGAGSAFEGDPYDALNALAEHAPAGSDGLIFLPYLQGERTPILDSEASGGWLGLTARHTRAHLVRSVMEGVAYSLRDGLMVLREAGVSVRDIRVTGGGARSAVWKQILADVLDVTLTPLAAEEGPALGAALLAGVAVGVYTSVPDACERMVQLAEPSQPHEAEAATYARFHTIYQELYPALRPAMHQLAALTR